MKTLSYVVILLFCFALPVHAAPVYSGCAAPPTTFRHVWYFDPVHGNTQTAGGIGTQAKPWNNLQALVQAEPGYTSLLLTTAPYLQPVPGKAPIVATGPKSGPIAPGDEIVLMSGNYGNIWINVNGGEISNSAFITIAAAPGQTPVLTSLFVSGTNDWVFDGLKVQSLQAASLSGNALVEIKDGTAALPTSNIVFENMTISSVDNAEAWTQAQWRASARQGFWAQSSAGGTNTKCISLTGSHISNVKTGAVLAASQLLFTNNEVDHFGDDGIDYAASNLSITKNNLHDNLNIGDGNHEDAMQGVVGVLAPGMTVNHFQNVLIDSNLVIRQTDPELSFPTYLQGIDAFNSDWTNLKITNNVIVADSCWGINVGSVHSSLVADNTVLADGLVASPGCLLALAVGGNNTSNTRVTNNLAMRFGINNENEPTLTYDHNVALSNYQPFVHFVNGAWNYGTPLGTDANGNVSFTTPPNLAAQFVAWNPAALSFNVMLKAGSVAIGHGTTGTATGAPTVDILGVTRTTPYAVGAYSYPR
jgi:Right handed beta helix region